MSRKATDKHETPVALADVVKEDVVKEVESEEGPRLVDDWEETPGDALGVVIEEWKRLSRLAASARARAQLKFMMARGLTDKEAKELVAEAQRIQEKEWGPILDQLEPATWRIVEILAEHPAVRDFLQNWLIMPPALRKMCYKGLRHRSIDVADMLRRAEEWDKEQETQALARR